MKCARKNEVFCDAETKENFGITNQEYVGTVLRDDVYAEEIAVAIIDGVKTTFTGYTGHEWRKHPTAIGKATRYYADYYNANAVKYKLIVKDDSLSTSQVTLIDTERWQKVDGMQGHIHDVLKTMSDKGLLDWQQEFEYKNNPHDRSPGSITKIKTTYTNSDPESDIPQIKHEAWLVYVGNSPSQTFSFLPDAIRYFVETYNSTCPDYTITPDERFTIWDFDKKFRVMNKENVSVSKSLTIKKVIKKLTKLRDQNGTNKAD